MRLRHFLKITLLLLISSLVLTACGGLAGEPEIVGQITQQAPPPAMPEVSLDIPDTQPDLALGAQIYAENCVRCHGDAGAGDGEFVQSGQIASIPDFTDPAQHEGRTPADYYAQVTNGNIQNLMPPFSGSLSDDERWSVANYVLTLAGGEVPVASVETTDPEPETPPDQPPNPHLALADTVGTVSGTLIHGTAGGTVPSDATVTLTVVEMTGAQTTFETTINPDNTYEFTEVPVIANAGYFVSTEYQNGTFNSEFTTLSAVSPDINLNITLYDTTDDDSVILVNVVLTQFDVLDENTLQVWQLFNVVNTSDRLYVYTDDRGASVSVEVPAPEGVRLSPEIEMSRFEFNDGAVYDTRPVVPNTEHVFHLMYTVPFDGEFTFTQTLPYAFNGPYEAYVDSSALTISGDGWRAIDNPQDLNGITYRGIVKTEGIEANAPIAFTVRRSGFAFNQQWLGYGVIGVGLLLMIVALFFYLRSSGAPEGDDPIDALMQQITDLDDRYEAGDVPENEYQKKRADLKEQLSRLMNS